jgi:hypothetical protein
MPFDECDLSSIEGDEGSIGDDGSMGDEGDEGSMWDGESVGDLSDKDTASVVSNGSAIDALCEEDPDWHISGSQPLPGDDNPDSAEMITLFLKGGLDLPKRSTKQWYRFFLRGHRMKTTDPELMVIAHNLKWGMWCVARQDYQVYSNTISDLIYTMSTVGLLSTPMYV